MIRRIHRSVVHMITLAFMLLFSLPISSAFGQTPPPPEPAPPPFVPPPFVPIFVPPGAPPGVPGRPFGILEGDLIFLPPGQLVRAEILEEGGVLGAVDELGCNYFVQLVKAPRVGGVAVNLRALPLELLPFYAANALGVDLEALVIDPVTGFTDAIILVAMCSPAGADPTPLGMWRQDPDGVWYWVFGQGYDPESNLFLGVGPEGGAFALSDDDKTSVQDPLP